MVFPLYFTQTGLHCDRDNLKTLLTHSSCRPMLNYSKQINSYLEIKEKFTINSFHVYSIVLLKETSDRESSHYFVAPGQKEVMTT